MVKENTSTFKSKTMSLSEKPEFDLTFINDLSQKITSLETGFSMVHHNQVIPELLKKIEPIDFRLKADLKNSQERLIKNHYIIIVIEEIKRIATNQHWNICTKNEDVFVFNGAYWQEIAQSELESFLSNAAIKMGVDRFDAKYFEYKSRLHKQFLSDSILQKTELEKDKVQINLQNGTFEITPLCQSLKKFAAEDFITYQLPFNFNPESKAPIFEKFLNESQPDIERQNVLAEYVAYLFVSPSYLKLEKALILYGKGANGKSVFFEIVMALLGKENVSNYSLQSLTDSTGYYRAKIGNKLLNYAPELTSKMSTDLFKQLVSGEPIEARLPYKEPFTLINYAKLIFNCNELPRDIEQTNAFFRRFLIIPFDVQIAPEMQDHELAKKIIINELSGIFNWVLKGLSRLLSQKGFSKCEASESALKKYQVESDSVQLFLLEEGFLPSTQNHILLKDIYKEYCGYCQLGNYRPCSNKTFSERLRNNEIILERKGKGYVVYLKKKEFLITSLDTLSSQKSADSEASVENEAENKKIIL